MEDVTFFIGGDFSISLGGEGPTAVETLPFSKDDSSDFCCRALTLSCDAGLGVLDVLVAVVDVLGFRIAFPGGDLFELGERDGPAEAGVVLEDFECERGFSPLEASESRTSDRR